MRITTTLGVGVLLGFAALAGCSAKANDTTTNPPGNDGGGSSSGDGGSSSGDGGTNPNLPKPTFCPETDPFNPTLPNSVVISDVVLQQDTTWTADKVYLIGDDFKIEDHTLTVEAGTTICIYQTGKIYVGQGIDPGEIHLNGTADKPITITAVESKQNPGTPDVFHEGILFDTFMNSTVSYTNIWYGGVGGGRASWALEIDQAAQGTDPKKPLLLDHVTIGAVQTKGVKIGSPVGIADGSHIQFTGFTDPGDSPPPLDAAFAVDIQAAASLQKALDITGANIPDAVKHANLLTLAADGHLDATNTDLVDFGVPYYYKNGPGLQIAGAQNDTTVGATLTIHEGVTLMLDSHIVVGTLSGTALGNLIIAGTAAKPVVLTSTENPPTSGDWEGLYYVGGQYDPTKSKIDNAQILYAGVDPTDGQQINYHVGRCGNNFEGAVMIAGAGGSYAGPTITNTKIAHSLSDGIVSDASDSGELCSTNYAGADITFDDIKGSTNKNNGACQ